MQYIINRSNEGSGSCYPSSSVRLMNHDSGVGEGVSEAILTGC